VNKIIQDVEQLEDLLSQPTPGAIESVRRLAGDIMLLGAGGKMGPTLARMARRASDAAGVHRRVIAVSRFSAAAIEQRLQQHGVETIRSDLSDTASLDALPDVPNIVFMVGMKFGATGNEAATWVTNVLTPALVCRRFAAGRIVAFSTGNVYGLSPVAGGGSLEGDPLRPVGEYAMTALGRERIFEHFSRTTGIPLAILRLNYAHELRYGVMVDLARAVWNEEPIDLTMGAFNAIWQADANAMALCAFDHVASPPCVLNITGPEQLSVRRVAEEFGRRLNRQVEFTGNEANDSLLSNAELAHRLFGRPLVTAQQMIEWIADWVRRGGETLDKPTHFQVRDGAF
jgi:nucleoside-diphosphate-sugar epimerase